MRHIITKAQAIKYMIYIVVALAIITVFPLRLWHENITTQGKEHPAGAVTVGGEANVLQQFSAEYDHIASIGVYLDGEYYSDTLCMRVFDANFMMLREVTVNTDEVGTYPGYADVYINLDTTVGDNYYYTVEGVSTDFQIPYEMTGNSGAANNGYMQYAGETKEAYNVVTRYTYEQPMRKLHSLLVILGIAALGAVAVCVVNLCQKKKEALQELCSLRWIVRIVCNPLIVICTIIAIVIVGPLHMFTIYIADIVVMILGILFMAGILLYAVNRKEVPGTLDFIDYVRDNWTNLLQSLCIALALWACVNYMNAFYEVFHDIAWRKMAFFLGLGLIVTFTRKEIFNWYNLAVLIAGCIVGKIYHTQNLPDMVDEYHAEALVWTCRLIPMVMILIAYAIRCIVIMIRSRKDALVHDDVMTIGKIGHMFSWPYTIMTIVLAAGMIIMRNTRYWPIMMTVIAGAVAVRFLFWDKRRFFLNNICNGILMHFIGCILYALWHRPYEAYEFVRFPFVFHTVTITAEYLSVVFAAALVKLFYKYQSTKRVARCLGEMILFGAVATYLLFTMSRTGMIAIVATGLVMWVAYSFGRGRKRIYSMLTSAAMVVCSTLICFPIFFSMQKAIPAVVGEPKLMLVEVYPQSILISKEYDSDDFISITRFAKAFGSKMIGLNEDKITWDKYTIDGVRENLYLSPTEVYELYGGEESGQITFVPAMLTGTDPVIAKSISIENIAYKDGLDGGFVPPREWPEEEGEEPPEWRDEEYWVYRPKEGVWLFAYWKIEEEQNADVSNGRMDIYRAYYEQLTREGHEGMGAILQDGSEAAHAHDIYLQVAYDNGIIVGVIFMLWVAMTFIQALIVFVRTRKIDPAAGLVLAVSVTYAVAGVTEWISHPCNPVGMVMLLIVIPMAMYKYER